MGAADKRGAVQRRVVAYDPLPSQRLFHQLTSRYRGFSGPVGSGKSYAGAQEALRLAYLNGGTTGLIGSPTYPLLRDTTRLTFLEILEANRIPHEFRKGDNELDLTEPRSRIVFRTLMEPERLRGLNLAWFWADELTYSKEAAWKRLTARLRHPAAKLRAGVATWTPKGFDWVYEHFIGPSKKRGYEAILAKPRENERNVGADYYQQLEHDYDERFFRQEVLGEYLNVFSGQVYFSFDRAANVRPLQFDPLLPLHWSLDFNINPMCSVIGQVVDTTTQQDRLSGRTTNEIRVLDELILPDSRTVHAVRELLARLDRRRAHHRSSSAFRTLYVYGDASGASGRTSALETDWEIVWRMLRDARIEVYRRVADANPPVRARVAAVTSALLNEAGRRTLFLAPQCIETIKDLEQVGWKTDQAGNATGELRKDDPARTHATDALGYMVYSLRRPAGGPQSRVIL